MSTATLPPASHGVDALIDRLRGEGLAAGRAEAERLIEAARTEAEALRSGARADAEAERAAARSHWAGERAAALDAIRLAQRDALLQLKAELEGHLVERLRRRVQPVLADTAWLQPVLAALLAGRAPPIADLERLAQGLVGELLVDGVVLARAAGGTGFSLQWRCDNLEVDLTEHAATELLASHLLPSVRALLSGGPGVDTL